MTDISYNQFANSNTCWEIYALITQPFNACGPKSYFSGKILERRTIFPTPQVNKYDSRDWLIFEIYFHFVPSVSRYSSVHMRVAVVYLQH